MDFRRIPTQLELFSQKEGGTPRTENSRPAGPKGFNLRQYEKPIVLLICFIVIGIISFSVGVERGRRLTKGRPYRKDTKPQPSKIGRQKESPSRKDTKEEDLRLAQKENVYTIQIASYLKQTHAESAAREFKKKGFDTIVMPKGKYVILCIGSFPSKDKADVSLKELKKNKTYHDSFIRRL